jgi:replicative DNA helicase
LNLNSIKIDASRFSNRLNEICSAIEQDADLIIMLYRDAYYNPDPPDRDITELIITKHRNGPTGVVKLVFDPALTKFKNLARPMN